MNSTDPTGLYTSGGSKLDVIEFQPREISTAGPTDSGEGGTKPSAGEPASGHSKGARPSTQQKHEEGDARRAKDRGGEKGDKKRRVPRKKPKGHKGPWPPKGRALPGPIIFLPPTIGQDLLSWEDKQAIRKDWMENNPQLEGESEYDYKCRGPFNGCA